MADNFTWTPDGPLPPILDHTKCKLDVITRYLEIYFDTLSQDVRMDRLNISLVDGFCGGGAYQGDDSLVLGSPLVLLKGVEEAERRINHGRRKPFSINARYFFVDAEPNHIARLRKTIADHGYSPRLDSKITLLEGAFESHLPTILRSIKEDQPAGRSVFILDQCGYNDVHPNTLKKIFNQLQRAEAILTLAIDGLLNYLNENSLNSDILRAYGIDQRFVGDWRERHGTSFKRPVAQRAIMNNLCDVAKFMTPFILRSPTDNRDMALIHLSNHQLARDKMLGLHWEKHNNFIHCGQGGLFTLGFEAGSIETCDALFSFGENDRVQMQRELMTGLPANIREIIKDGSLPVTDLLNLIGNRTAARNEDVCETLRLLAKQRELVIKSPSGGLRRPSTLPSVGDIIEIPKQRTIFSMFRNDDR